MRSLGNTHDQTYLRELMEPSRQAADRLKAWADQHPEPRYTRCAYCGTSGCEVRCKNCGAPR